jgi:hypothetical protein
MIQMDWNDLIVGAKHPKENIVNDFHIEAPDASPLRCRPHGTVRGLLTAMVQNFMSVTTRAASTYPSHVPLIG